MDIQTKDGILLRNIPDGTPDDAIKARIADIRAGKGGAISQPTPEKPEPTGFQQVRSSMLGRFVQGIADPVLGALQLVSKIPGVDKSKQLRGSVPEELQPRNVDQLVRENEKSYEQAKQATGADGIDVARIAGNIASPANYVVSSKLPAATTLLGKMGAGAATGANIGALQPVHDGNYGTEKSKQVLAGTVLGGVIPTVGPAAKSVGRGVQNLLSDVLPGGVRKIAGRVANEAAGVRRQAVIDALLKDKPIVSQATAGEAATGAGSAEFSALQKILSARKPSDYNSIAEGQQAARVGALNTFAKDKAALSSAEAARAAAASKNYKAAYQQAINADPELATLAKNPYFKDALPDAMKLAQANGIDAKKNLTEFLHLVKISLDKTLGKTGDTALSNTERSTVEGIKKSLISWIAKKNPAYDVARKEFELASKPINQMQVGQYLRDKLVNPLSDDERATSFAQAVRDAPGTLKRSTGFKRYDDLSQVLAPSQLESVNKVAAELARKAQFEKLANSGTERAREILKPDELPPSGMFSPIVSVARGFYNRLQGKASDKAQDYLAEAMKNPQEMAKIMEKASPAQRKVLHAMMRNIGDNNIVSRSLIAAQENQ